MTEELKTVIGKISEVSVFEREGQPTRMKLHVTEDNMFTGKTEDFTVALTESESNEGKDFKEDRIKKAFDRISEYTETELEVPKSISKTSIEKALKPVKGKEIEVFVGSGKSTNEEGIETGEFTYYSLYETNNNVEFLNATMSISELMKQDERFKEGTKFEVKPVGFQGEVNTKYFVDGKPHDAEMLENTATRIGFARELYKILKADTNEEAGRIRERLEKYIKNNTVGEDFLGTTGGIIQQVGVFSDQSKRAKNLDDITVLNLEKTLSNNKSKGRAYTGTARLIFSIDGFDGELFKTRPLKEAKIPRSENFVTTFNPKDTNFMEFANFTEPLHRLGALTMDDFKEIQGMTVWHEILRKIQEVIEREGLVAEVSIDSVGGGNHYVHLLGFKYGDSNDTSVIEEGDELKQKATTQAKEEQEKVEHPTEEKTSDDVKSDNPFAKEDGSPVDIDDDDLPF